MTTRTPDELVALIQRERHASWILHNSHIQSIKLLRCAAFIALQAQRGCEPSGERCKAGTDAWRDCDCGLIYDRAMNTARSCLTKWEADDIEDERRRIEQEAANDPRHGIP